MKFLYLLAAPLAAAPLVFTHGVASGDVTSTSVVLWTRVDREAALTAEVSRDASFQTIVLARSVFASAAQDHTAKVLVEPLDPGQAYFYRWRGEDAVSEAGAFQTAPRPDAAAGVRFAYSGDSDGIRAAFNHFEALEAARREGLDFFVYLGDTIYADSGLLARPAQTLDEYRQLYKVNRELPALRDLLKATSTYAIWDDHEVRDDFQGQTVDRTLYANGRQAFLEYMPLHNLPLPDRAFCAGDPLFRYFHWGKDIDIIIPDERSCRSAEAVAACSSSPGAPDLAPTLPAALRIALGMPASPPAGCLEALNDPARTMLGHFQKLVFLSALLYSKAKFKFIINEDPIQHLYALPYDRWEGYVAERNEILRFIRDNSIRNVIFLTTDSHANLINRVYVDGVAVADEFVTGPIATSTLLATVQEVLPVPAELFRQFLQVTGASCANLDAYSYGLVEVDAAKGTATITLKDDRGAPLEGCSKTIGP